jgi:hypothetical protein
VDLFSPQSACRLIGRVYSPAYWRAMLDCLTACQTLVSLKFSDVSARACVPSMHAAREIAVASTRLRRAFVLTL